MNLSDPVNAHLPLEGTLCEARDPDGYLVGSQVTLGGGLPSPYLVRKRKLIEVRGISLSKITQLEDSKQAGFQEGSEEWEHSEPGAGWPVRHPEGDMCGGQQGTCRRPGLSGQNPDVSPIGLALSPGSDALLLCDTWRHHCVSEPQFSSSLKWG